MLAVVTGCIQGSGRLGIARSLGGETAPGPALDEPETPQATDSLPRMLEEVARFAFASLGLLTLGQQLIGLPRPPLGGPAAYELDAEGDR